MRRLGVGADADHLGAGVLEVLVLVAEGARFLRAARRVVLRIEVEDDRLLAAVVAEAHRAAAPVREREVGRRVADADARGAATEQVEESHALPGYHHHRPRPTRAGEDGRSDRSTPIAGATGCPRERVLEPVVAPEELVADHGCRRAEDAEGDRPLRLGAETRLRLGRPGGFDQRAARLAERVEDGGDRLDARDVAILDEVGVEHGAHEPELERRRAHAPHEGTGTAPTQHLFSARRRCDDRELWLSACSPLLPSGSCSPRRRGRTRRAWPRTSRARRPSATFYSVSA